MLEISKIKHDILLTLINKINDLQNIFNLLQIKYKAIYSIHKLKMKKSIALTFLAMIMLTQFMVIAIAAKNYSDDKIKVSAKCIAKCSLQCVEDGEGKNPWELAACVGKCVLTCTDASIDPACATSCVESLCSKFLNSGR